MRVCVTINRAWWLHIRPWLLRRIDRVIDVGADLFWYR